MSKHQLSRRTFTATAAGVAVGIFAASRPGLSAQEATPDGTVQPVGFVSTRVRSVGSAEQRALVNERVREDFAPEVARLEGFLGYILGDVVDKPEDNLAIVVLQEEEQFSAFGTVASEFVASLGDNGVAVETVEWTGDLLVAGSPTANAIPAPTPVDVSGSGTEAGYVTVRIYQTPAGVDPREAVPTTTSGLVPILAGLPGFRGFLWYPTGSEVVAISVYDSEESANESTNAAREWVAEFATQYTEGDPEVINAHIVYANLPIFG